jgi:hypothetical protein
MPERGIPKDAEYVAELKEASLDAAAQVLSGLSLAKRLLQAKEEQISSGFQRYTGIDPARAPALGDLLLSAGRLHAEHVRTALKFQRWVSERVLATIDLPQSGGAEPDKPAPPQVVTLEGSLGAVIIQEVVIQEIDAPHLEAAHPEARQRRDGAKKKPIELKGYTQVTLRPGVRAYLDWSAAPKLSKGHGGTRSLRLSIRLDAAKLTAGTYTGVSVVTFASAGESRTLRAPFTLRVSS